MRTLREGVLEINDLVQREFAGHELGHPSSEDTGREVGTPTLCDFKKLYRLLAEKYPALKPIAEAKHIDAMLFEVAKYRFVKEGWDISDPRTFESPERSICIDSMTVRNAVRGLRIIITQIWRLVENIIKAFAQHTNGSGSKETWELMQKVCVFSKQTWRFLEKKDDSKFFDTKCKWFHIPVVTYPWNFSSTLAKIYVKNGKAITMDDIRTFAPDIATDLQTDRLPFSLKYAW